MATLVLSPFILPIPNRESINSFFDFMAPTVANTTPTATLHQDADAQLYSAKPDEHKTPTKRPAMRRIWSGKGKKAA